MDSDDDLSVIQQRFKDALTAYRHGKTNTAQAICNEILLTSPNEPHSLQLLGLIGIQQHKLKEAIYQFQCSLYKLPNDAICHHNLASAYQLIGAYEKAVHHYQQALQLNPDYIDAYYNFAFIANLQQHPEVIAAVEGHLKKVNAPSKQSILLHYTAGKYYHAQKNYLRAFQHFQIANQQQTHHYDPQAFQQLTSAMIALFTPALFKHLAGAGDTTRRLVFLVGMPTAGIDLLDAALSAHARIASIKSNTDFLVLSKELDRLQLQQQPFPQCLKYLTRSHIKGFASVYLAHANELTENTYLLNGFANNFLYLGLIKIIFPQARIIHCQRNAADACLASYFKLLPAHCEFSHSLAHIARFYRDYQRMMQHWQTLFPQDILTISFEKLVQQPQAVMQKVLDFLALNDSTACLQTLKPGQGYSFEPGFAKHYHIPQFEF